MSKITAVIPIRGGSKRCKNKSIRNFADTTLLELRINTLKKVKGIDIIQVNSDCDIILKKATDLGVEIFKRDPIYATDDADGKMVYKCLSEACSTEIMLIAFTPTPFIDENDYQNCIDIFKEKKHDSVISVHHKKDYMFYNNKPVNFNPLKTCKSQDLPKYYNMTFGVTIVNTNYVKKNHSIWTENPYLYEVDELKALDIDTNMDFHICEEIYKKQIRKIEDLEHYMNSRDDVNNQEIENNYEIPDDVYLGAVYDALNLITNDATKYVLNIKPMAGYNKLIHGPAFTITGNNVNKNDNYEEIDKIRYTMYKSELFKNNPIILIGIGDNNSNVAHFGDITCQVYKKLGAIGLITDGIGRDIDLIDKLNFPVFCKNVNPIDAFEKWAYIDFQKPILIENKNIYPNDYIFADRDGVIFVPNAIFNEFKLKLNEVLKKEREIRNFLKETTLDNMDINVTNFVKNKGRF
jgi:CMP-N-acetylneuraminic acid synthetase/regulator of RNase E activity RraA